MADTVIVNASTGQTETRPLTAEEQRQRQTDTATATQIRAVEDSERANETTISDRLDQALTAMKAHVDRGTFTVAQRDAALLLVLRVCIGLVRRTLRRLDAAE